MGKRKALIIIAAWLALALADGLLTWIGTPDLSLEANPLVSYFGLGWGALFTANAVVFILYAFTVYYAFVLYERKTFPVKSWKEYISMLLYNRPDRFRWIFYRLRMNWRPAVAVFGYAFGYAALLNRAILVFEWVAHLAGASFPWYHTLLRLSPYSRFDMVVALIAMIALMIYWFYQEYKYSVEKRSF